MKTAVVGYPRIGTLRELKFALEKYFRKETSADELTQTAKELRKIHWLTQKEAGIDYITSNDFSYYDIVLDTAFLLNIIPERYRELEVSELDKYLAMARGYQSMNSLSLSAVPPSALLKGTNGSVYTACPLDGEAASKLYADFYAPSAFTRVTERDVDLKQVVNTNKALLHTAKYGGKLHVVSVIDNLLKGASGQAVQNMNLMFGLDEKEGLRLKASAF